MGDAGKPKRPCDGVPITVAGASAWRAGAARPAAARRAMARGATADASQSGHRLCRAPHLGAVSRGGSRVADPAALITAVEQAL